MKLFALILFFSFGINAEKSLHYATCTTFKCIEGHENQEGRVQGLLRVYTPNEKGKGAGHMFWSYEILLSDSIAIPVISKSGHEINLKSFLDKEVVIECVFYNGIIIGGEDENAQAARGWRIDATRIKVK